MGRRRRDTSIAKRGNEAHKILSYGPVYVYPEPEVDNCFMVM